LFKRFGTVLIGYLKVAVVDRIQLGSVARRVISVSRPTNPPALLYLNVFRSQPREGQVTSMFKIIGSRFLGRTIWDW
jgi:hypothetical protein